VGDEERLLKPGRDRLKSNIEQRRIEWVTLDQPHTRGREDRNGAQDSAEPKTSFP
jgi:hypothetical protein